MRFGVSLVVKSTLILVSVLVSIQSTPHTRIYFKTNRKCINNRISEADQTNKKNQTHYHNPNPGAAVIALNVCTVIIATKRAQRNPNDIRSVRLGWGPVPVGQCHRRAQLSAWLCACGANRTEGAVGHTQTDERRSGNP